MERLGILRSDLGLARLKQIVNIMEKRYYKESYLPFVKSGLIETPRFLDDALDSAGGYSKSLKEQGVFIKLFSKILRVGKGIIGSTFSLNKGDMCYPLPLKWLPIIDYLKEKELINDIFFPPLYCDEPRVFKVRTISSKNKIMTDGRQPKPDVHGNGDSLELEEAISKSIGEFLERFTLTIYQEKDFLRASLNDLRKTNKSHLDINYIAGFSAEQKSKNSSFQFNKNTDFFWQKGKSLFTNKDVLIPVQLIFWNYNFVHQAWQEPFLRESNSNGAGGHYTLTKAILAGLYELIQRDGFLIYWLNRQAPPRINLETINYQPLGNLLGECQRLGLKVHFLNTATEIGVPSCICAVLDDSGVGPKLSIGADCGLDWPKTLLRALLEGLSVHHWARDLKKERGKDNLYLNENYKPFQDYSINHIARVNIWANLKMFKHFQFFLKGKTESLRDLEKRIPQFSSSEQELDYLIEKFKSLGDDYEIFYYQAKHQALKDLGYVSVKVVVPVLINMYLNEPHAPLGAKRLKEVPQKLGFKPADQWNPWPHPFP